MQKLTTVINKINKKLMLTHGEIKFLLWFHWQDIISFFLPSHEDISSISAEAPSGVKIKKISFDHLNNCILYLTSSNNSVALKLHYAIPEIIKKIYQVLGYEISLVIKIK